MSQHRYGVHRVQRVLFHLINDPHYFTHLQILHGGTQVSDWSESQAAVTLVIKKQ